MISKHLSAIASVLMAALVFTLVVATPARSAYLIQGDTAGFLQLLNSPDVSVGGTWSLTPQNGLQFAATGQTNTFVNQLLAFNNLDRTVMVGNNVPFVFFGAWGPQPGLGLPPGTQVLDLADFSALRANIQFEALLDTKASILLHELAEVGTDGVVFGDAHRVGIVNENLLLRNGGSIGQRLGPPDKFVPGVDFSEIKFPWQNTRAGINGFEVFRIQGKAGNDVVPLLPQWVAGGAWDPDISFDPTRAPSNLQINVIDYFFVPEAASLTLLCVGLLGLIWMTRGKR